MQPLSESQGLDKRFKRVFCDPDGQSRLPSGFAQVLCRQRGEARGEACEKRVGRAGLDRRISTTGPLSNETRNADAPNPIPSVGDAVWQSTRVQSKRRPTAFGRMGRAYNSAVLTMATELPARASP